MTDGWYFWDRNGWYWSALSLFCVFFIVFVMVCLCWKLFHPGHHDDDEGHVIVSRDPAPSLIILHAQTPPSENERILRRYDGIRSTSHDCRPQFYYHSPDGGQHVPYNSPGGATGHHAPYNCCSERQTSSTDSRPPPYAPNY